MTASEKLTIYNYILKTVVERCNIRGFDILNFDHHSESLKELMACLPQSSTGNAPPEGSSGAKIMIKIYPEMAFSGSMCVYRNRVFLLVRIEFVNQSSNSKY